MESPLELTRLYQEAGRPGSAPPSGDANILPEHPLPGKPVISIMLLFVTNQDFTMPIKYETHEVIEQVVSGFTCNKCGKEYTSDDIIEMQEAFIYRDTGGFGSVFGDEVRFEIVLCQHCAYDLLADYAITIE